MLQVVTSQLKRLFMYGLLWSRRQNSTNQVRDIHGKSTACVDENPDYFDADSDDDTIFTNNHTNITPYRDLTDTRHH